MGIEAGRTYKIINVKAGTAVDLSGTDGESIIGWESHDGDNQKWSVEFSDANEWVFKNVGTGKYLGRSGDPGDGVAVVGVDDPVGWDVYPDEQDGSVDRIFAPGTPFNLDLTENGNADSGTPIAIWGKWEGSHQTWRLEPVE